MKETNNIIALNDEYGNEVNFEFLDIIEYHDEDYIILLPYDETDEASEVVILQIEDNYDDESESYISVNDENTLVAVFEIFKEKFKDMFIFID